MSDRKPTRAELLERIAASSKDAVVLQEMQRLGFWPANAGEPTVEAALINREAELVQTLHQLHAELREMGDPEAALKALHRQRMAQARERRETTAQAREQRRHERAVAWQARSRDEIGYLGQGVSAGLKTGQAEVETGTETDADAGKLQHQGLPLLSSPLALAQAMGIEVAELKFLCFHREVGRVRHYQRFSLPKKTGGVRTISAPMPRLKRAQYWVLDNVLARVPCHPAAHGFVPGRSIVSNAAPHCGQDVIINLDLKDFFPGITYPRIKGVFRALGYGETVATLLALLCSENVSDELLVDGERFFVGGPARARVLPQGVPTSPMLTNVLCRRLDRRLQGVADKLGFVYTRYADDLSFSASGDAAGLVGRLLRQVHFILKEEGLTPHPDKLHVQRAGTRQEVTGVVVNQQPAVSRTQRRQLRATLHRARQQGLAACTWQGRPASADVLIGYAQFVKMVQARHGTALLAQARALSGAPARAASVPGGGPGAFRQLAAQGKAPPRAAGPWWVPAPKPQPALLLTAGQIKVERQTRLAAQRAERQAVRAGASVASESAVAPATLPGAVKSPVPWGRVLVQFLLMLQFSIGLGSATSLFLGLVLTVLRVRRRRLGWPSFVVMLLILVLVGVFTLD